MLGGLQNDRPGDNSGKYWICQSVYNSPTNQPTDQPTNQPTNHFYPDLQFGVLSKRYLIGLHLPFFPHRHPHIQLVSPVASILLISKCEATKKAYWLLPNTEQAVSSPANLLAKGSFASRYPFPIELNRTVHALNIQHIPTCFEASQPQCSAPCST